MSDRISSNRRRRPPSRRRLHWFTSRLVLETRILLLLYPRRRRRSTTPMQEWPPHERRRPPPTQHGYPQSLVLLRSEPPRKIGRHHVGIGAVSPKGRPCVWSSRCCSWARFVRGELLKDSTHNLPQLRSLQTLQHHYSAALLSGFAAAALADIATDDLRASMLLTASHCIFVIYDACS
jgi:hypothetical protein